MKASEVIKRLREEIEKKGDLLNQLKNLKKQQL